MIRMLAELTRWERWAATLEPVDRWTRWAEWLAGRRGRVDVKRAGAGMTLASRQGVPVPVAAPVSMPVSRWERAAWTFAPQIHLAIQPILQQMAAPATTTTALQGGRMPAASPALAGPLSRRVPLARWGSEQSAGRAEAPGGGPRPAVVPLYADTPVRRVIARAMLEETGETETVVRARATEALVLRESRRILHRVVEERKRVEQRVRHTGVVRESNNVGAASSPAVAGTVQGPMQAHSPWGPGAGGPGMAQVPMPRAVDIEGITDQVVRAIDHRLVAYRERMGQLS